MPYEGEYASYLPLHRIAESDRVRQLLSRARTIQSTSGPDSPVPIPAPCFAGPLPEFVVAVDGSSAEVPVRNGYPGARVGYCTVASVLLNLCQVDALDEARPVDPKAFRQTEQSATIDAALPGANVVVRNHTSARESFREALYETFYDVIVDEDDRVRLLETYEALLALKPDGHLPACPYEHEGCDEHFAVGSGTSTCRCDRRKALYSTDALRIHERFQDGGSNGEAYGEVMQVWERLLLVHLLRCFERRQWLDQIGRVAFFLDGPLAVFGHPAWLSAAISRELRRLNVLVRQATGNDLLLLGIEKSGTFVEHFAQLDQTDSGEPRFGSRTYLLPNDAYIKQRIVFSTSPKRYGADTYFGRKVFYKTRSGARIVCDIPFLSDDQDTLTSDDVALYPQFPTICGLLDKLVSSRYPNALSPIVSAHAQAAIPLHLGSKVLQQLALALMRRDPNTA